MNRLALGTVQFGMSYGIANRNGQVGRPEARAMLQLAAANGIDMLDTAIAYGESETCLGEVGTEGLRVVTKLPAVPVGCPDVEKWVNEQIAASLGRLKVSGLYGLLLHRPGQLLEQGGAALYGALQKLKESGLVQKTGVSIYAPGELEELSRQYRFDLVQAPFNLIDRRLHTSGWMHRLKKEGAEIHVRSAFLQGLLLMPREAIPAKFAKWSDLLGKWHDWLARHSISAVQACLAFPLSFPEIDHVVVGADSVSQLQQIIRAANSVPPSDLPDLACEAEDIINPARWSAL
jgi:aryl-alcohol dehydrogenase-like predicted oxidoreductase